MFHDFVFGMPASASPESLRSQRGQTQNIEIYSAPFKAWFLDLRKVNVGYRA